jgi:hypothetical protein
MSAAGDHVRSTAVGGVCEAGPGSGTIIPMQQDRPGPVAARLWQAARPAPRGGFACRPVTLPPGRVLCACIVDECCEPG